MELKNPSLQCITVSATLPNDVIKVFNCPVSLLYQITSTNHIDSRQISKEPTEDTGKTRRNNIGRNQTILCRCGEGRV